jgi:hypothetical protein
MRALNLIHLAVGIGGVVAFVLTGQYMAIFLGGLTGMPDVPRLLYRTSHIYLMWAALLNLIVGCYFNVANTRGARILQAVSSGLLLASPVLMLASFFVESGANDLDRVLSNFGNFSALGGAIIHAAASLKARPNGAG